ncbi:TusE/DsrC/DsvC family sulfur relay protein, partial [Escherichia coli]|uniref:TusE/DsrC/DsvC family sulfur relay protein n=1 Tax=Escherichia coli TaxID=562 RepID=UPI000AE2393A
LEAEEYIARTFGAEQSYIVTNGTSTSNKIVGMYAAPSGSTLLIDRNCHKSLAHLLMMNDVVPVWLKPTRNALGILGGIPRGEFTRDSIEEKVAATTQAQWPVHAVITNSTYDGLLYNTDWIKQTLDVPSIHFDSAWVPYTHFHPIYQGKSGMSGERVAGKVIFEGKEIETDTEGYLKESSQWSEPLAVVIAENEGIALSPEHWEVVRFVRDFYLEFNTSPAIR